MATAPATKDTSEPSTAECCVCGEPQKPNDKAAILKCNHIFCKSCLNEAFEHGFANRMSFPPRCCNGVIHPDAVLSHLSDKNVRQVEEKYHEWIKETKGFCCKVECYGVLGKSFDRLWKPCLQCQSLTCRVCGGAKDDHSDLSQHPRPEFQQADADMVALAAEEEWKLCPRCHVPVEWGEDGCTLITCPCGQDFCIECGNPVDFIEKEDCGCPWGEEDL